MLPTRLAPRPHLVQTAAKHTMTCYKFPAKLLQTKQALDIVIPVWPPYAFGLVEVEADAAGLPGGIPILLWPRL